MYQLERHGVQVAHVDREGHDLWVRTPSGRMLTVQVKTASLPTRDKPGSPLAMNFFTGNLAASTDLYALVALHAEIVLICDPEQMRRRWLEDLFTPEAMTASIKEHLA